MKASSPPTPPPGPDPVPPEPAASDVTAPAAAPAPAPSSPKHATWPGWFGTADFVLAVLAIAVAFLAASYAARNSDLWLHLAGGRLVAQGQIRPGVDPFSYTGADRAWVDSAWLYDVGLYAAFSADPSGAAAVGVKAAAVAVAFGLLFFLRRPGQALWPWAVLAVVGLLAAVPYLQLRPIVASTLFLSGTFVLLGRRPWAAAGWREPLTLAGLFWVWGNCDVWAVLGPVVVALTLLGGFLNRFVTRAEPTDESDPFPPAPPTTALAKTLGLGVVAVLLNPMFLGAVAKDPGEAFAQLVPVELGFGVPIEAANDAELAVLLRSPLGDDYQNQANLGRGLNGGAFGLLLVGGALALMAGFARLRAAHILLWVLFTGLALIHVRLIPYFAVAAVPLAAGHLNGLSSRVRLGTWTEPKTRVLLTASGMGRVLSVLVVLAVGAATYPGWTMPLQADPAYNSPLEWAVRADAGAVRTAGVLEAWRADGRLPADLRGLIAGPDLGDYCTWFAPREKVFVDSRYVFHRRELPDLLAVRAQAGGRRGVGDLPEVAVVRQACEDYGAGYAVFGSAGRRVDESVVFTLLGSGDPWPVWHLDGRGVVLARPGGAPPSASARLRFDPVRTAFGPNQPRVPDGKAVPPAPPTGFEEYTDRPARPGPDVDDAFIWADYDRLVGIRNEQERVRATVQVRTARGAVVGGMVADAGVPQGHGIGDDELALPVLVLRAARRAAAATPDRPEPYRALIVAYRLPFAPIADVPLLGIGISEPKLQVITAQVRFLDRLPEQCPLSIAVGAVQEALLLAEAYRETGQRDFQLTAVERAARIARGIPPDTLRRLFQIRPEDDPLKPLQDQQTALMRQVQQATDVVERQQTVAARFRAALASGLPALAIKLFSDASPADFGNEQGEAAAAMVALKIRAGQLERAAADLAELDKQLAGATDPRLARLATAVRGYKAVQYRLQGDLTAVNDELDRTGPPRLPAAVVRTAGSLDAVARGLAAVGGPIAGASGANLAPATARPPALPVDTYLQAQLVLQGEALYQYDRAVQSLVYGDVAEAKRRFQMARRPQGADLASALPPDLLARVDRYLSLLDRAATPPPE